MADIDIDLVVEETAPRPPRGRPRWLPLAFLAVWGPGLIVMLADTDAGSLITAGQSGAQFGYKMILPQVILMPILYVVQEMTVRLGMVTGKGHGALIRERFGRGWAWLSAGTLFVAVIGALLTEFAGVEGVGELFGVSKWVTIPLATIFLLALALTGSYGRVERIGIGIGLFELAFIIAMFMCKPHVHDVIHGLSSMPLGNHQYLLLLAANVGAVIMPWMIFYQQGAVVDKKLTLSNIKHARRDTAFGAVLTQIIMLSVVVAVAAAGVVSDPNASFGAVSDLARALEPIMGSATGKVLLGLGMLGGALVAAIVASIAGSWGLAESLGWKHTLNERPSRETAKFYTTYALAHIVGAVVVLASLDLTNLTIIVEVMNAVLLPIVLGFLLALEIKALPPQWRMRGVRKYVTWIFCLAVMAFGLYMIPSFIHQL